MCLAIPSKIISIKDHAMGTIDTAGVKRQISLHLVQDVGIGDHVLVHAGYALEKIDEAAAPASLKVFTRGAAGAGQTY